MISNITNLHYKKVITLRFPVIKSINVFIKNLINYKKIIIQKYYKLKCDNKFIC
jgi:hypothetical protein